MPRMSACFVVATNWRIEPSIVRWSASWNSCGVAKLKIAFLIGLFVGPGNGVQHHRRELDVRLVLRDRLELELQRAVLQREPLEDALPRHLQVQAFAHACAGTCRRR